MSTTIMLASHGAIGNLWELGTGLAYFDCGVLTVDPAFAQGAAESAAENLGFTTVERVWFSETSGGLFAELSNGGGA